MASGSEILRLCRLCLTKDEVNIPIFEDVNDISQVFLKISACLPVKVSRNDKLPKKICDSCSYKLGLFYEFLNTSTASEKQLLTWVNQPSIEKPVSKVVNTLTSSHAANGNSMILKQEVPELLDVLSIDEISPSRDLNLPSEAQDYVLQQQQLPYDSVEFEFQQDEFVDTTSSVDTLTTNNAITLSSSCKRGAAVLKVLPDDFGSEEESDLRVVTSKMAKTETGNRNDKKHMPVVDLPSTSDNNQPGPSGLGKPDADAPTTYGNPDSLSESKIEPLENDENCDQQDTESDNEGLIAMKKILANRGYKNPFNYTKFKFKDGVQITPKLPSSGSRWSCLICNEIMISKNSLIEHYSQHKTENEIGSEQATQNTENYFKCVVCSQDFTSLKAYEKHLQLKHGENAHICEKCNRAFQSFFQLNIHYSSYHIKDGTYRCLSCNFTSIYKSTFKNHILSHEEFECDICDQKFLTISLLEIHKSLHTDAMPFRCEICNTNFPYYQYLVAHKESVHSYDLSETFLQNQCNICKQQFAHKKSLIMHKRTHTGENEVLCDICGKRLSNIRHLNQHVRVHIGYKPHGCSTCGKSFSRKSNLTLHERVHTGEKPYICNVCQKTFSQRSTLVTHKRYHTGERPYTCPLCSKGFVAKGVLGIHLKTCSVIL